MRRMGIVVMVLVAATVLAACGGSGPEAVSDGTYRFYAASSGVDFPADATLVIEGDTATFTVGDSALDTTFGEPTTTALVCPPDGEGDVMAITPIDGALFTIVQPGIFGDCGDTSPSRVTIVDLMSADDSLAFPFTRWVEMCNTQDEDC